MKAKKVCSTVSYQCFCEMTSVIEKINILQVTEGCNLQMDIFSNFANVLARSLPIFLK